MGGACPRQRRVLPGGYVLGGARARQPHERVEQPASIGAKHMGPISHAFAPERRLPIW
mgnify:CR=1 FL=1